MLARGAVIRARSTLGLTGQAAQILGFAWAAAATLYPPQSPSQAYKQLEMSETATMK